MVSRQIKVSLRNFIKNRIPRIYGKSGKDNERISL
jgi:hypothetical protein